MRLLSLVVLTMGMALFLTWLSGGNYTLWQIAGSATQTLVNEWLLALRSCMHVVLGVLALLLCAAITAWAEAMSGKAARIHIGAILFFPSIVPVYVYGLGLAHWVNYPENSLAFIPVSLFALLGNGLLWWWHERFRQFLRQCRQDPANRGIKALGLNPDRFFVAQRFQLEILRAVPEAFLWTVVNVMFIESAMGPETGILAYFIAALGGGGHTPKWVVVGAAMLFVLIGWTLAQILVRLLDKRFSRDSGPVGVDLNGLQAHPWIIQALLMLPVAGLLFLAGEEKTGWASSLFLAAAVAAGLSAVLRTRCFKRTITVVIIVSAAGMTVWCNFDEKNTTPGGTDFHSSPKEKSEYSPQIRMNDRWNPDKFIDEDKFLAEILEGNIPAEAYQENMENGKPGGTPLTAIKNMLIVLAKMLPGFVALALILIGLAYINLWFLYGRRAEMLSGKYRIYVVFWDTLAQVPPYLFMITAMWVLKGTTYTVAMMKFLWLFTVFMALVPLQALHIRRWVEEAAQERFLVARRSLGFRVWQTLRDLLLKRWGEGFIAALLLSLGMVFLLDVTVKWAAGLNLTGDEKGFHWINAVMDQASADMAWSLAVWITYLSIMWLLVYLPQQVIGRAME
ncbi:MAG: hypothetical protein GY862_34510 [Gammaproteobacteria bacterium]|nr:hypothetical protein [Gammaproteobacteria bacterium]